MEEYGLLELADETIRNYEKRIRNYIKPALGCYTVTSLDTYAIQRCINQMVKSRYSRNTIVGSKGIISKSLKYAKRMRWVARNEALEVELPSWNASRRLRKKTRAPLSREQIRDIFYRFPEGSACYTPLLFGYRAGTRLGETFALCWNDIDFENNRIDVNKQVQWYPERKQWRMVPPKYDSCREVDMDRETMAYLRRERQRQIEARFRLGKAYEKYYVDDEGYINTVGTGKEIHLITVREDGTYIQSRVMQHYSSIIHHELGNKAFDFHTLRHTHATELEEAGVAMKEIQRRLGHKSEMTTRRVYVHQTDEMRIQSVEIINTMYK
jgi:integrase